MIISGYKFFNRNILKISKFGFFALSPTHIFSFHTLIIVELIISITAASLSSIIRENINLLLLVINYHDYVLFHYMTEQKTCTETFTIREKVMVNDSKHRIT